MHIHATHRWKNCWLYLATQIFVQSLLGRQIDFFLHDRLCYVDMCTGIVPVMKISHSFDKLEIIQMYCRHS